MSTRRHTANAAVVEYRRFEADPHGYDPLLDAPPETAPGPVPVVLSGALQDDYPLYSANHCENSEGWYNKKRYYLSWWADQLRDVNLRGLEMEQHVFPALKHRSGRAHAVAVLKHFIGWMRDPEHGPAAEFRLAGEEGRCVIDYEPKSRIKAKQITKTRWFPYENWLAVRPHLSAWQQDAGDVLAATGWHSTELLAFVRHEGGAGHIEDPPGGAMLPGTAFAMSNGERKVEVALPGRAKVLVTRHKGGHIHKTLVSLDVAKIADGQYSCCWNVPAHTNARTSTPLSEGEVGTVLATRRHAPPMLEVVQAESCVFRWSTGRRACSSGPSTIS